MDLPYGMKSESELVLESPHAATQNADWIERALRETGEEELRLIGYAAMLLIRKHGDGTSEMMTRCLATAIVYNYG